MIAVLGGLGAAFAFAVTTLTSSRTTRMVGPYSVLAWVMLTGLIVSVPLALVTGTGESIERGDVVTKSAAPLLVLGGLCEVAGLSAFMWGARDDLAVSAVLSAQFAGLAALAAFLFFGERFGRVQVAGIALVGIGVALVAALQ